MVQPNPQALRLQYLQQVAVNPPKAKNENQPAVPAAVERKPRLSSNG